MDLKIMKKISQIFFKCIKENWCKVDLSFFMKKWLKSVTLTFNEIT